MYPVIALIVLMLFTWIVAMWASCGENDEPHDEEKPEQSSDEQDHQEAAVKQDVDRPTASSRSPEALMHHVREDLLSHLRVPKPRWRILWSVNVAGE